MTSIPAGATTGAVRRARGATRLRKRLRQREIEGETLSKSRGLVRLGNECSAEKISRILKAHQANYPAITQRSTLITVLAGIKIKNRWVRIKPAIFSQSGSIFARR